MIDRRATTRRATTRRGTARGDADRRPPTLGLPPIGLPTIIVLGVLAGLAFAAPTFSGDLLLNLDQVIGRTIPVPSGFFGEGSELPRRMPFYVLPAALSRVIPGPAVVGLVLVGSTAAAMSGLYRRASDGQGDSGSGQGGCDSGQGGSDSGRWDLAAAVAAFGYGLSPFILTRGAVGHLPVVVAAAMLPWAMGAFESGDRRRIVTWAAAIGLTGSSGAMLGLVPASIAVVSLGGPWIGRLRDLLLVGLTQVTWLAPGLVVLAGDGSLPTSPTAAFATRIDGAAGALRLPAGGGFFVGSEDVAARAGPVAAVLGLVLLAGGVAGLVERGRLDVMVRSMMVAAAAVLLSTEGLGSFGWQPLTAVGPLTIAREAQRLWPLVGLGLAVGLAATIRHVARIIATPAVAGGVIVVIVALQLGAARPGLLGADGRLDASPTPAPWAAIERAIERAVDAPDGSASPAGAARGSTVVLPWRRYDRLSLSGGRNVLQPAPWLLDAPVLISGDPGLSAGSSERDEPLHRRMVVLDLAVRGGASIAPELRRLGVSQVLIAGSPDAPLYRRIGREEDVEALVEDGGYALYRLGGDLPGPTGSEVGWGHSALELESRSALRTGLAIGPTLLVMVLLASRCYRAVFFSE